MSETVKSASHEDEGIFHGGDASRFDAKKKKKKKVEKYETMRQQARNSFSLRLIVLPTCAKKYKKIPCSARTVISHVLSFSRKKSKKEKYAKEN